MDVLYFGAEGCAEQKVGEPDSRWSAIAAIFLMHTVRIPEGFLPYRIQFPVKIPVSKGPELLAQGLSCKLSAAGSIAFTID